MNLIRNATVVKLIEQLLIRFPLKADTELQLIETSQSSEHFFRRIFYFRRFWCCTFLLTFRPAFESSKSFHRNLTLWTHSQDSRHFRTRFSLELKNIFSHHLRCTTQKLLITSNGQKTNKWPYFLSHFPVEISLPSLSLSSPLCLSLSLSFSLSLSPFLTHNLLTYFLPSTAISYLMLYVGRQVGRQVLCASL